MHWTDIMSTSGSVHHAEGYHEDIMIHVAVPQVYCGVFSTSERSDECIGGIP